MNKFFSANKSKIVWILVGAIAILIAGAFGLRALTHYLNPFTLKEPPSAVLRIQGVEQMGYHEGYCWEGFCLEYSSPISTSNKALITASPFSAMLKFTADEPPQAVSLKVFDVAALGKPIEEEGSYFIWEWKELYKYLKLTKDLDLKNEQTFTLELERGLYVITVSADWAKGGTNYSFLIDIQ